MSNGDIEVVRTCPLGHKCQEVKDNKIHRCMWYTKIQGMNPQTGEEIDEWNCAMGWIPILLIENSNTNRGQTSALESFRNEMVNGQGIFNEIMEKAVKVKQLTKQDYNED